MREQLRGGGACATKGFEGGGDVARVVVEARGVEFLIVGLNDGAVFGEQLTQAHGGAHFAVGEMVDDLGRAPLAGDGLGGQLLAGEICEGAFHFVESEFVLPDQLLTFGGGSHARLPLKKVGLAQVRES